MKIQNDILISCVESDLPDPDQYYDLIKRAHDSNRYANFGALSERFSTELLAEFGLPFESCVTCNSATAGISAALLASDCIGTVLVPGFTFPATYGAVLAAGLQPLVMDVSEQNWAISADALENALDRTGAGAVVLVSPFGLAVDFAEHVALCRQRDVVVVIDSAAGLGVARRNICAEPDVYEVFSLHATKPLGIGEGGVVFCSPERVDAVKSAINFGLAGSGAPPGPAWGFNGKLSELHAAVGLAQLQRYKPMMTGRQRFATLYQNMLAEYPVRFAEDAPMSAPWQVFPVLMPSEDALHAVSSELADSGIGVRRYYRPSLSQWHGAELAAPCPVSEMLAAQMIALPIRNISDAAAGEPILSRIEAAFSVIFEKIGND